MKLSQSEVDQLFNDPTLNAALANLITDVLQRGADVKALTKESIATPMFSLSELKLTFYAAFVLIVTGKHLL